MVATPVTLQARKYNLDTFVQLDNSVFITFHQCQDKD